MKTSNHLYNKVYNRLFISTTRNGHALDIQRTRVKIRVKASSKLGALANHFIQNERYTSQ